MLSVDWTRVRLVVFDVDGTLYDQRKLRARMAVLLLRHLLKRPTEIGLVRTISIYRRCREGIADEECGDIARLQYERPARRLGISSQTVKERVDPWIYEKPLAVLPACRYPHVEKVFEKIRDKGRKLAVLSDYPAKKKVEALGLEAGFYVSATDPEIDRLKPNPAGLAFLIEKAGVEPAAALMIGDRDDRDGESARRLNVPYLIKGALGGGDENVFNSYSELLDI
jgi:phosphoglycolate phosphatase/putative hydrolase of the HAD superfamily